MKSPSEDTLILSAKLASGNFETELRIPLSIVARNPNTVVLQWLALMQTAFKTSSVELKATLEE